MRYNSHPWYLLEAQGSMKTRRTRPRKASVELRSEASQSTADYRNEQALLLVTLRNIRAGDELAVGYGIDHSFKYCTTLNRRKKIMWNNRG